ncbi:L-alanine exporter AlaE [Candidatus Woesearchaeota archaeon]|nr:L-alanine exporter AlaE [Candidatus Woesearchaeota archaeon]
MSDLEDRLSPKDERKETETPDSAASESSRSLWYSAMKDYLVDTSSSLIFYAPVFTFVEYVIAGMESNEVLKSRTIGTIVGIVTARPYGKFREWWSHARRTDSGSSQLKKLLTETSGLTLFTLPCYVATLTIAGASFDETVVALPSGLALSALSSRPYGYFLDRWRKLWGGKPTLSQ